MGTSGSFGGPGGGTPLVPTWLEPNGSSADSGNQASNDQNDSKTDSANLPHPTLSPVQSPSTNRFKTVRNNFSRFISSGGSNRVSLGRAISGYVSTASGGARQAALRMGSSRKSGAHLIGFLSDVQRQGVRGALRTLNLESLAGRPIEEVFLGLMGYICPEGGTIDEGIARAAFIETIADLAENGITDLNSLTADQMKTVFELYATHAIEARLCNDIGSKIIFLPRDVRAVEDIQMQLRDFIRRSVSDSLTATRNELQALMPDRTLEFVDSVYEQAFAILQILGEEESV